MQVTSTFPVILPTITDTSDSITMTGWYGSVYLIAFGVSYAAFTQAYQAVRTSLADRVSALLSLFAMAIFIAGGICCYTSSSVAGILVGRSLLGTGAAGAASRVRFVIELLPVAKRAKWDMAHAIVFACAFFLGPM
jgi:hypothetical protein